MDGWMEVWMDGCMNAWMYGWPTFPQNGSLSRIYRFAMNLLESFHSIDFYASIWLNFK